ncbi:helix-turn-helix transcriptional regulator [Streptomyces sp. LHD-70]|uniref:helix-turn-helix domain-containing protein n=1 Tax=Streptomyces sp. LHD-70 TaxID=3072140 RepID=UPI00280FEFE6|nr:helix-turn-helix transcriptional regulator [Streptomyces sp. LHD-70]MDQ8707503.1 helix-turn-helix transcriptional regulator [Streptomyces sp. LHD-70]
MDVPSTPDIGAIIRGARCAARLTQTQLGQKCGYSASAISRIESNQLRLEHQRLLQLAVLLNIPPNRLTSTPVPATATIDTVERPADEEDAVRRRNLLTGAVAAGATAVVGASPAGAAPASADPAAALEEALFRLPSAPPAPLTRLTQQTATARADYCAARYTALARALPDLIATATATRDSLSGREREQAGVIVARAYVLATELALKQHNEAAWVAADRALAAARAVGHPVPIGESSRVLAITMRRSGQCPAAVRLLRREATDLDPAQTQTGAVRTTLLLTAAYTAANGTDRNTALDLLDEAGEQTERHQDAVPGLFTVDATRAQVDAYRISVLNALGTPDEGVRIAQRLDIDHMSTAERRARAWTDTARMWHALGDGPQTLIALRHVEQEAPQEVRRPALRALTTDLLYAPARVPGVREFAIRTGAVPA